MSTTVNEWVTRAACRGMDTTIFFGEGVSKEERQKAYRDRELAFKTCANCPVQSECLNYAVDNDIEFGIFGGMNYRRRLKYKRAVGKLNLSKAHTKE